MLIELPKARCSEEKRSFEKIEWFFTNVVLVVLFSRSFTSCKLTKRLESATAEGSYGLFLWTDLYYELYNEVTVYFLPVSSH